MENKNTIRLDKFLWFVRLCKTRTISAKLCSKRKIKVNDVVSKPSKNIALGDILEVNIKNIYYKYQVLKLLSNRIGPKIVKNHILDITPEEELDKLKINSIYPKVYRKKGMGRPTKKERRILKKNKIIK